MNELHADPLMGDVATDEAKTGATYGDLTTVGPSVTKTLVAGQKVWVEVSCRYNTSTDGGTGWMSFAVSGASTLSATDANAAYVFAVKTGTNTAGNSSRSSIYTATNGGSHTFTAKYKSDGTTNMHFVDRRIVIKPY